MVYPRQHFLKALVLCLVLGACKNPLGGQDSRDSAFSPGGGSGGGGSNGSVLDSTPPSPPTNPVLSSRWVSGPNPTLSPTFDWQNPSSDFDFAEVALGISLGGQEVVPFQRSNSDSQHVFANLNLIECSVIYFPSVRALDAANNRSAAITETLGFRYDNSVPSSVGSVSIPAFDANAVQTVTVDWSATPAGDNCGLDHYEVALGYDDDNDGFDAGDIGNLISWSEVPGGASTTSYQIRDGVDGFSFNSSFNRQYFISVRGVDEAGLTSVPTHSPGWYTFHPSQMAGVQMWFDGADANTTFQDSACTLASTLAGDPVGCWRDKSGNNNHSLQATAGFRPKVATNGMYFDGADDILTVASKNYTNTSNLSIVLLYEADLQTTNSSSCCRPIVSYTTNSGGLYPWLGMTRGNLVPANNLFHGWVGSGLSYLATTPGDQFLMSATQDAGGAFWNVWTNGTQRVTNQPVVAFTGTAFSIGGDVSNGVRRVHGVISSLLVFERVIAPSEREILEGYIACQFGTRDRLDPAHPYYDLIGANVSGCP